MKIKSWVSKLLIAPLIFSLAFGGSIPAFAADGDQVFRDNSTDVQRLSLPRTNTNGLTGALTYSYPIVVPPGRGKLTPDINFTYSNQNYDNSGIYGYGWSDNIPYIERQNKRGVENMYSDYYFSSSLSGELASTTSTDYSSRNEDGSFYKYTFSNNTWIAKDKLGYTYTFGTTTSARQNSSATSSDVYRWMLEEVRDTNDNYVKYEYTKDNGQIYPYKITYTGNGVTDGPFEIEFLKQIRSDISTSTKAFFPVVTKYRINEIYIKVDGTWVRKYNLAYSAGHNGSRSLLTTINDYGRDDSLATTSLPATTFSYQTPPSGFTETSALHSPIPFVHMDQNAVGTDEGVRLTDINGDGLTDIIQSFHEVSNATTSHAYINTGNGYFDDPTWYLPVAVTWIDNKDRGVRLVDINGDGLTDVLQSFRDSDTNWYRGAYINNGHGFTYDSTWNPPIYFTFNFFNSPSYLDEGVQIFDINGDGLHDIVQAYDGLASTTKTFINTGNGFVEDPAWDSPVPFLDEVSAFWERLDTGARAFDINGDGLTDIIQSYSDYDPSTLIRHSYINNGHGFTENSAWNLPIAFMHQATSDQRRELAVKVIDVNSDGLLDLVKSLRDEGVMVQKTHLNTGSGFSADNSSFHAPMAFFETSSGQDQFKGAHTIDVNGDGIVDVIESFSDSGSGGEWAYINNAKRADKLNQVNLNTGGTLSFTYKASPLYLNGATTTSPSLPLNVHTVEKITTGDGMGNYATTTYSYAGGSFYFSSTTPFDRKFAGFASTTESDPAGSKTITYFHQGNSSNSSLGEYNDHVSKIGRPYRIEKKDQSDNAYAIEVNKWDKYNLGTGIDFIKLTQKTELTYDGDGDHKDKAENYSYIDTNGNLVQKISWGEVTGSTDGSFSDTGSDKFITAINYATDTPAYILALPSQETITDQSAVKVKETKYYYDTLSSGEVDDGNLTKEEKWKASSTYIDTEKTYNGYGLVTQEKDPRDKITTYSYDSYNLYPATSTNPLSQATAFWYDYSLGKPNQVKDANGYVFQTAYDGLDRVTSEKQPDQATPSSLVTKTSYTYTDNTVPTVVQKTENLDGSTAHDTYSYIDGLGRVIQERKESESSFSVKDFIYNSLGLIAHESLPYFSSGSSRTTKTGTASLYVNYLYDALNRVSAIGNAVGTTTNAYDDWKLTVTDPNGEVKYLYKDAHNRLARVDEINGGSTYTTNYEYDGNNNLTKITDADSNVRNFTYDGLSRKLTSQDLHDAGDGTYGSWTYVYDDAGNMASSTDPKSQIIDYTYDDINRVLTENYTGGAGTEISYGYDSCVGGIGKLCSATTTSAVTNLEYNPIGLVKKEVKNINSTNYITQYTYNRLGKPTSIIYPDSSEVAYTYNAGNLLEQVQQKESGGSFDDVVSELDYSPTGKVSFKEFGNEVTSIYTYDPTQVYRLTNILTSATSTESGGGLGFLNSSNLKKLFTKGLDYMSKSFSLLAFNGFTRLAVEALDIPIEQEEISTEEVSDVSEQVENIAEPADSVETVEEATPVVVGENATTTATTTPSEIVTEVVGQEQKTIEVATTTEKSKKKLEVDSEELKIKAPKEKHLGKKEYSNGEVKYAYRSDLKVDQIGPSEKTIEQARNAGLTLGSEVITERTKHARTFSTNDPKTFIAEIISGNPQYYKDDNGEWWVAEYATTTKESYEHQTKESILQKIFNFLLQKVYAATDTFYPDPNTETSTVDGRVWYCGEGSPSWSDIRGASSGTDLNDSIDVAHLNNFMRSSDGLRCLARGFFLFDTSSINDNATISSSTLSLYVFDKYNGSPDGSDYMNVFHATTTSNTSLSTADYNDVGSTKGTSDIDIDNITTNSYLGFQLNSTGLGWISKTGVTKLGIREGHDLDNVAPTDPSDGISVYTADNTGTSNDPKLVVVYSISPDVPTSLLTEGQTNPTNVTDNTPEFSAIYVDADDGDLATYYKMQVSTSSSFTTTYWDSSKTSLSSTTPEGTRTPDISYGGSALASSTTYYWRIKFWDQADAEGSWSTTTSLFSLETPATSTEYATGNVQNIYFTYDAVGNITDINDTSSTTASRRTIFTYDDLHRLTLASTTAATSTPFIQRYSYNSLGNITEMKTGENATSTYSYAETGYANPHAATSIAGTSLTYDNNGNVTSNGTKSYAWDYRNRLASSTDSANFATTTYGYDHTNQRVTKATGATTTVYANNLYNTDGTTKTKHIYAGDELVSTITTEGATVTTTYLHTDHLGGLNASTDETGALTEVVDYYPYGDQRISTTYNGADPEQRKYTGHEYDAESDLTYANARYYEQNLGKWVSLDVASRDNPREFLIDPQQLNSYSYGRNNPLILVDPTGNKVSEYQPYSPSGSNYQLRDLIGEYRGTSIFSRGPLDSTQSPFQCVDLVKKFVDKQFNVSLTGNAVDYGNQNKLNEVFQKNNPNNSGSMSVYTNGGNNMPQENDIISWSGGTYGHVGIIAEVQFDNNSGKGWVYSVEQNYGNQKGLFAQSFTRTYDSNGKSIYTVSGRNDLQTQGWARYENQNKTSKNNTYTTILHTPAPKPAIKNK